MKHTRTRTATGVLAALLVLTAAARAAEVGPCGDLDRVSSLVGQTRSFSEGKIRVAHVDTDGEPVCCSSHALIIIPAREIGSQCFAVSQNAATGETSARGFNSIELAKVSAAYDPRRGLLLTIPYTLYNPEGGAGQPAAVKVRVDLRGDGSVAVEP